MREVEVDRTEYMFGFARDGYRCRSLPDLPHLYGLET